MPFDAVSYVMGTKAGSGGGTSVTVEELNVTDNGEYTAPSGTAYNPVNVAVPQTTVEPLSVNSNATYTAPSGKAYSPVVVNVPNSYTAGDEGKVVSNGALVAQTSDTVTANDTYDTTLINSLTVNVSGGGDTLSSHFLVIKKETITVGENSVTNGVNCVSYLMGMLSDPGDYFVFMSLHEKESYVRKEWAMCLSPQGIGGSGYRFENGGVTTAMNWGAAYDVLLVPGSVIDVYTYSNLNL